MMDPLAPRQHLRQGIFRLLVALGASVVALFAFEVIYRLTTTTIVDEKEPRFSSIETHPEILIRHTRAGKRLQPNARVTIRNHRLSRRDILIETNSLGFRDRELD